MKKTEQKDLNKLEKDDAAVNKVAPEIRTNAQGAANPDMPEEYEENLSMNLRMQPQPLTKKEKKFNK